MAQFLLGKSTLGAHVTFIFMLYVSILLIGDFVQAQEECTSTKYSDYVTNRVNFEKLYDGISLQNDFTLSAIKEVVSLKKTLDNMGMMTGGVLEQTKQDISRWLSTIFNSDIDINAMENLLEMRERAIRSVQDEVKLYASEERNTAITRTIDDQCAWVNHRVLDDCTSAMEHDLTAQQNTTKTFFVTAGGCFDASIELYNSALNLCHSGCR